MTAHTDACRGLGPILDMQAKSKQGKPQDESSETMVSLALHAGKAEVKRFWFCMRILDSKIMK